MKSYDKFKIQASEFFTKSNKIGLIKIDEEFKRLSIDKRYVVYSMTYFKAAGLLSNELIRHGKNGKIAEMDLCVLPLCFLYRHSLELLFKGISKNKNIDFQYTHSLYSLYEEMNVDVSNEQGRIIKDILHFIEDIDPNSVAYRYPKSKKQVVSFDELEVYSLTKLNNNLQIIYFNFLNAFDDKLQEKYFHNFDCSSTFDLSMDNDLLHDDLSFFGVGYANYYAKFSTYADGYFRAAEILSVKCENEMHDELNLPLFLICETAIELKLKSLFFDRVCYEAITKKDFNGSHDIRKSYNTLLNYISVELGKLELNNVRQALTEFLNIITELYYNALGLNEGNLVNGDNIYIWLKFPETFRHKQNKVFEKLICCNDKLFEVFKNVYKNLDYLDERFDTLSSFESFLQSES